MLFGVRVQVDPMRKSVSMNDLSQYVPVSNSNNVDAGGGSAVIVADSGYASADDSVRHMSNSGRERKRGVPWTEEEHKLFLLGLQKVGKGDWRGISRNYVKTRTPTQVASHAQKYFLRRSNLNRRRRRSSLFDITTDSVAAIPMEEQQVHEDNNSQLSSYQISPLSGFPIATFPATVSPVPSLPFENQIETVTFNNGDQINAFTNPIPNLPWANQSTKVDNYSNQKQERNSLSLSLNLSLSYDNNRLDAFPTIPSFKNGDGIISVA